MCRPAPLTSLLGATRHHRRARWPPAPTPCAAASLLAEQFGGSWRDDIEQHIDRRWIGSNELHRVPSQPSSSWRGSHGAVVMARSSPPQPSPQRPITGGPALPHPTKPPGLAYCHSLWSWPIGCYSGTIMLWKRAPTPAPRPCSLARRSPSPAAPTRTTPCRPHPPPSALRQAGPAARAGEGR